MNADQAMKRIDTLLSHVWMVRTFLKHCDEVEDDEDLQEIHRTLYDFMLALGKPYREGDAAAYLKQARKKFGKLVKAAELFAEIQPEVSTHTNFQMANQSLAAAMEELRGVLDSVD